MPSRLICACGECNCNPVPASPTPFTILLIEWQRLVHDNKTSPRCGDTEAELEKAYELLTKVFEPLGVKVQLNQKALSLQEFKQAPTASNPILINGRSLEALLGAKSGESRCCDVCGDDAECRTVEFEGQTFEAVPAKLIVLASLEAYVQSEKHALTI